MRKLLPILAATTLVLTGCSDADTQQEEKTNTVNVAGQNWECQPVPDETMQRIMDGDKWDDGAHATVDEAVMVQGADNNFIAANITWEGQKNRSLQTSPLLWTAVGRLLPQAPAPQNYSTGRKPRAGHTTAPTPQRNA